MYRMASLMYLTEGFMCTVRMISQEETCTVCWTMCAGLLMCMISETGDMRVSYSEKIRILKMETDREIYMHLT